MLKRQKRKENKVIKLLKRREEKELLLKEKLDRNNIQCDYENETKKLFLTKRIISYYIRNLNTDFLIHWISYIDITSLNNDVVNTLALLAILENKLPTDLLSIIDSFTYRQIKEKECEDKYMEALIIYKKINQYYLDDKDTAFNSFRLESIMKGYIIKIIGDLCNYGTIVKNKLLSKIVIENNQSYNELFHKINDICYIYWDTNKLKCGWWNIDE
jgi:hypothetical protein